MPLADIRKVQVIAPNFKRRLSGVTSTIIQLLPVQSRQGVQIAALGPGLPDSLPHIRFRDLLHLWSAPDGAQVRIWHARRNLEMLPAIVMRDMLRMKIRIVFTSASQRKHSSWTRFLISKMDAVVATSAKTAGYLTVPNTVVMHGIDATRFEPASYKAAAKTNVGLSTHLNYVGCFGRVRHQKGTDLFVDTMIALLPQHPEWAAVIAGRATAKHVDFENGLKKKVSDAGLADRILFVGEHTNINEWHRAMDLFVAPQRWEGFGLTPLEAMASGVPVVATDVGAFPELIMTGDTETGEIIERNNLDAMTAAAARFMTDERRLMAAGEHARQHVTAHFSIEGEAKKLGKIYTALAIAHTNTRTTSLP